ncbi:MAG: winged helix-turn-helix domain-containing protein [Gammaproteobacteria bacterium]|jgi:DNA-binding winged helix-turn-helix (wHTH) protein|nr:winged helix-turn-helix domain-containing protein [Gammaproteobacteria bacterium]
MTTASARFSNEENQDFTAQPALQQAFRVGAWRVQPELNRLQLIEGDECRHLEPRLIHLLSYLAANENRVLSRDDLVQELWPSVIVNENSLTRAVSELRKQLSVSQTCRNSYIETIPKKGYRLLVAVDQTQAMLPAPTMTWTDRLQEFRMAYQAGLAALCLSLVTGFLFNLNPGNESPATLEPVLLSGEVMGQELDIIGGELRLSHMEEKSYVSESIATPVVSNDDSQYAYIQYDQTGSTIFLGSLNGMDEPSAIFNSPDKLFNLAWSPLGNAILFAKQPTIASTALFTETQQLTELFSLNLDTLETRQLIEEVVPSQPDTPTRLSLT